MKNTIKYNYLKERFDNIFVWSDTHLGHANIVKFYPKRAPNIYLHDKIIIENWNDCVTDKDLIIHLGDFSFKSNNRVESYLKQLKGYKILLQGNHDNLKSKGYDLFDEIHSLYTIKGYSEDNLKIILCHYPIESWEAKSHGSVHLHGHVHGDNHHDPIYLSTIDKKLRRLDVGVESVGMSPILLETAIELAIKNSL